MAKQYNKLNQFNTAPKEATKIGVFDASGNKVGVIPISGTSLEASGLGAYKYSVGLLSDIHVCNKTDHVGVVTSWSNPNLDINLYHSDTDLQRAFTYYKNYNKTISFVCISGDTQAQTSLEDSWDGFGAEHEYDTYTSIVNEYAKNNLNQRIPVFMCAGNHDDMNYFKSHTYTSVESNYASPHTSLGNNSFAFTVNNDCFIFISVTTRSEGDINSSNPFPDNALSNLDNYLTNHSNNRCFIFIHYPVTDTNYAGYHSSSSGLSESVSNTIKTLMNKHSKAIWFSGHTHWIWPGNDSYSTPAKTLTKNTSYLLSLPSCAKPRYYASNARKELYYGSLGAVMDVYENGVIIKGIDFNTLNTNNGTSTENTKILPTATYKIMI